MAVKKKAVTSETPAVEVDEAEAVEVQEVVSDPRFTKEALRERCVQIFGVTSSTFDGAMFGKSEKEYTIAEAKAIVNDWLGRKVG